MNKNRQTLYMVITLAASFLFFSCQNKNEDNAAIFNTLKVEKSARLADNDDSPECIIHIEIDEINDTTDAANKINEAIIQASFGRKEKSFEIAIDSFTTNYINRYKNSLSELYQADLRAGVTSSWYDYRYKITSEHFDGYNDCFCYKLTTTKYEGGVREYTQIACLNFDKQTGAQLDLYDLLLPSYVSELQPLLLEKLLDDFDCETIDELHQKGLFRLTDVYVPKNYLFGPDCITFIYNVDEIAPYEIGLVSVDVPYKEIELLLK